MIIYQELNNQTKLVSYDIFLKVSMDQKQCKKSLTTIWKNSKKKKLKIKKIKLNLKLIGNCKYKKLLEKEKT